MQRLKDFVAAAVILAMVALGMTWLLPLPASAVAAARPESTRPVVSRPRHPHFALTRPTVARVMAPSHHPAPFIQIHGKRPEIARPLATSDNPSLGDLDTDTDDGVFTVSAFRYRPAADVRVADLPLGTASHPLAPVVRPGAPRGPPAA